ncbi:bifunctional 3-(3-hydroxy-phenyl)propionate/3-hydroxycinnamic acid hydroxylase [Rhizobium sp. NPDC090279]|uniref:bifunctional 3-(3-hydroxy-phenyl)propionate/3-hydroxycinnamic acid hydroxylase n=1 Tax=Rhizobium sp. NPDC090279 TaxID=3364499 RepID=UPI00383A4F54
MQGQVLSADVIIVGLGPVGAVAANLAAAAGFDVLVLEKEFEPFALPRAIVFDAEIMRIFDQIGLAEELAGITRPLGGSIYLGSDGHPIRSFHSRRPAHSKGWWQSNIFYQPQLEATLRKGLARYPNVRIEQGCEVQSVVSTDDGVTLTGKDVSKRHFEAKARYLLACDGASSTIRKCLGIGLDDIGFEERWLVIDAHINGSMRWPEFYEIPPEVRDGRYSLMVCDPKQPATLIPGLGKHRRWEYMLLQGESDEEARQPRRILERLSNWVDPDDVEIIRSAVYRFRALVAETWRHGSTFLLGDAAHQTPPFFGQGMCHGIRDAAQLIWRLSLAFPQAPNEKLLDDYQVEREPHVREIIAASVRAGAAVCITDPTLAQDRDNEFRAAELARKGTVAIADIVPPIRSGLIDAETGGLRLPEFAVANTGAAVRLDTILNGRFTILSPYDFFDLKLDPGTLARWKVAGGEVTTIGAYGSAERLRDIEERFGKWLSENKAVAIIVRPDRYIYGLAQTADDLHRQISDLLKQLEPDDAVCPPSTPTEDKEAHEPLLVGGAK